MNEGPSVSEDDSGGAWAELEKLAKAEYGHTVEELFAVEEPVASEIEYAAPEVLDSTDAFWRVGRLVGITIKKPFAEPAALRGHPSQTGALRRWDLKEDGTLDNEHPDWWQYNLILGFLASQAGTGEFDWLPRPGLSDAERVASFLIQANSERGIFRTVALGIRRQICQDRGTTPEEPATRGRFSPEPVELIAAGSVEAAAATLADQVSWLADPRMSIVTTGIGLLILRYGLDGFCRRTLPQPRTDIVET